ncbi:MAG: phosphoenolpyruvate carboxylase [Syntrophaceae bacterium]|nr:phosphoenolpyruvate carboxylase [Syntrophaceae bacterium]
MRIPRVMSTQHPDNVLLPFFAKTPDMSGDDEVQEAYYCFSHLGCDEQMWDCEGKEVDDFVVRKLLTDYGHYFRNTVLGRDQFLTLRIPNPDVEREEAKVLIEALESIPRQFDAARAFYGEDVAPIFEVILPMTSSAASLNRIYHYYRDFVIGKQKRPFFPGDITIAEWIGAFKPERINVIPLFEDLEHMIGADGIVREYLKGKDLRHLRVFLARSDPAMNYGMVSAVLCNKIALNRLRALSDETGVEIHPILGAGSPPFRGHLTPDNVDGVLAEYAGVRTFTVQSAFKYDHPAPAVMGAVQRLREAPVSRPPAVDEGRCLEIIDRLSREYRRRIESLAPLINRVAALVPRRRTRKLHVGLFGYARQTGKTKLPRAIGFCAACYSLGLPPEIIGLSALGSDDAAFLKSVYVNFDRDIKAAMRYFNRRVLGLLPEDAGTGLIPDWVDEGPADPEHEAVTSMAIEALKDDAPERLRWLILEAAHVRRFLG